MKAGVQVWSEPPWKGEEMTKTWTQGSEAVFFPKTVTLESRSDKTPDPPALSPAWLLLKQAISRKGNVLFVTNNKSRS